MGGSGKVRPGRRRRKQESVYADARQFVGVGEKAEGIQMS